MKCWLGYQCNTRSRQTNKSTHLSVALLDSPHPKRDGDGKKLAKYVLFLKLYSHKIKNYLVQPKDTHSLVTPDIMTDMQDTRDALHLFGTTRRAQDTSPAA